MLFSLATATLLATIARASVPVPALLNRQDSGLLPLGQNCTENAECQSEKCWPVSWYYGQTVCSPSPAGVACTDGSTCISGQSHPPPSPFRQMTRLMVVCKLTTYGRGMYE